MTQPASEPADPVGSVADEATRLFGVLAGRVRDHTAPDGGAAADSSCRWCPLCQAIDVVRGTSPETRAQVTESATALVLALRELVDQLGRAPAERARGGSGAADPGAGLES
ncbi:MAG: hypothetical protein H0U77_13125 [Nocardioidaceae bacterium]|nr:hypothetical protein [Nocardioidaceae bacterium]